MTEDKFKGKSVLVERLAAYGFSENEGEYTFSTPICEGRMTLHVIISVGGKADTRIIDEAWGDEYTMHRVIGDMGSFVAQVRREYDAVIDDIIGRCFETRVFIGQQAEDVVRYVRAKYCDEIEFLWEKFPGNGVARRKASGKWYLALLNVPRRKIGQEGDDVITIIDLRGNPSEIPSLIDNVKYFSGYHMNKKHWYTIPLEDVVCNEEIFRRIDESYLLAK